MITTPLAWSFTGRVFDKGSQLFSCAMCARKSRFSFEAQLRKKGSNSKIYLGRECAAKVFNPLAKSDSSTDLAIWMMQHKSSLYADAKSRRFRKVILNLMEKHPDLDLKHFLYESKKGKRFSPRQAMLLSSIAKKAGVELGNDLIPISMTGDKNKQQIKEMKDWEAEALARVAENRQQLLILALRTATD